MTLDLYQLIQILYWIALATAFGGVLFVALSAPVIFQTVRDAKPILPHVLSVNLENQHGTLLAGTIVGNLLAKLGKVHLITGLTLLLCIIAQFFLIDLAGGNRTAMLIRIIMFLGAVIAIAYDRLVIWPRLLAHREQYIENADDPDQANPAKEAFDRDHHQSVTLLSVALFCLLGMILFSANISPKWETRTEQSLQTLPCPGQSHVWIVPSPGTPGEG